MTGLTESVANIALVIILAWAHGVVQARASAPAALRGAALGLLHGVLAIASMQIAIRAAPDLLYDSRAAIIAGAGAFGGPLAGILAGALATAYRLWIGGSGYLAGIGVIASSTLVGLAVDRFGRHAADVAAPVTTAVVGIVLAAVVLLWTWALLGAAVLATIWLPMLLINAGGYGLLSLVLGRERGQRRNEAALRESERKFRAVFDQTFQFTVLLTPLGCVTEANQAALRLAGRKGASLIGSDFWNSPWWNGLPDVADRIRQAVAAAARGELVRQEIAFGGPEPTVIDLSIKAVRDPLGCIALLVAEGRDITRRRQAEDKLRQAYKMEAVGQLTGGIAHDFNNILTVIISNLELMRGQGEVGAADRSRTEVALQAAVRGATLTQRLLAFGRKQPLRPRATDVQALLGSMRSLLQRSCGENIELSLVLQPQGPGVLVDPNQLENAVLNLVLNARDAMPDGGRLMIAVEGPLVVDATAALPAELEPGSYVTLSVEDNGIGMEPAVSARIFEPFFTTKETGHGTGLGLSMVYGFVKQSGGHVTVASQPGRGTRLTLYLPAAGHVPVAPAESQEPAAPAPHRPALVLVVEDDALVRLTTVSMLEQLGYEVCEAASGGQALKLLDEYPRIELLFTDIGLPGMNGHQLAAEARRRRPQLGVILATGYDRSMMAEFGSGTEQTYHLSKPYFARDLERAMRKLLPPRAG